MWTNLFRWLLDPSGLTPHGFCLLWEPGLIWTYAISDVGIGVAYFTIPWALAVFARRRRDLVFRPIFWLFAAFILLCGTTHWLDVLTLFVPAYGLEAAVKVATASASLVTAVVLWRLLPQALSLPSPAQLREANAALRDSEARLHQAQKMDTVGQLTGGMAHDFNNMLQGIAGSLELMERRIEQGRLQDLGRYLGTARQAVDSAAGLTHRLLAFSRRQALMPAPIRPTQLVRGMEELIRRTVGPEIQVQLRLQSENWHVLSDTNQLESALLNLAVNARDAMPEGGTLTIATANRKLAQSDLLQDDEARPGDYVAITVTDTGIGMTADVVARAFEPFFTTKPIGRGTGLGLSQIYGFIRQSGGFVRLASTPGRGTSLAMYLPRHTPPEGETASWSGAAADLPAPDRQVAGRTVLVVDDEDAVRAQIAEAVAELGCAVLQAGDGPEGLRIVQSASAVDLLVTDIGLPGMNGRQLAELAQARRPSLKVILITGYAGAAVDLKLAPGMELLRKPFVLTTLTERICGILARADRREPTK